MIHLFRQRTTDPELTFVANEIAWVVEQIIDNSSHNAEMLAVIKPCEELVIHCLSNYESWNNVVTIKHNSHP